MKQAFYLIIILVSSLAHGQTEFNIHIESDVHIDSVSIRSFNLSRKFNSQFKNGVATIKIPSESSDQYTILLKDKKLDAWFNSGEVEIFLNYKNSELAIMKTANTPVYERQIRYFKKYRAFLDDRSLNTDFIKDAIIENDQDAFVLGPLNHYLKLAQNDIRKLSFADRFLKKQPLTTKEHNIYSMITTRLEKLKSTNQIELNNYSFINTDGNKSKISINPNSKFIVLDFWFTACPPCIKEHNLILENPEMFNDLNTEFIGVSIDQEQQKWNNYLKKKNITWKNYRINESDLDKDLGIWSFPTYVILDSDNNVLGSYSNINDTIKALNK